MDEDRLVLPDPVRTVHRLTLERRVPPRIMEDHGLGKGQPAFEVVTRLERRMSQGTAVANLRTVAVNLDVSGPQQTSV